MLRRFSSPALFLLFGGGQAIASNCRVLDCANCAIDFQSYQHQQTTRMTGNQLSPGFAQKAGTDLVYHGPTRGDMFSYGPYFSQKGSEVALTASFVVSTDWQPDTYETCRKRNWKSRCVSWNTHNYDSGFKLDYMVNGELIWSKTYSNMNKIDRQYFRLPPMVCDGPAQRVEARINGMFGGSTRFTVHQLEIDARWNP